LPDETGAQRSPKLIMRRTIVAANSNIDITHTELKPYLDWFLPEAGEVSDIETVSIPSSTSTTSKTRPLHKLHPF
jgi:hypothetical protein